VWSPFNPATPTKSNPIQNEVRYGFWDTDFHQAERRSADVRYGEERGFIHAWIPDSHIDLGRHLRDAWRSRGEYEKNQAGTGAAIASNRIPPVTVHSDRDYQSARARARHPGDSARAHRSARMGLPPVKQAEFREEVRVIHDLLHDGEATYNTEGLSRKIKYLHRGPGVS